MTEPMKVENGVSEGLTVTFLRVVIASVKFQSFSKNRNTGPTPTSGSTTAMAKASCCMASCFPYNHGVELTHVSNNLEFIFLDETNLIFIIVVRVYLIDGKWFLSL
jgi:hypothetical protein